MRARNIKPGFFQNEDLAECTISARLLFIGLWLLADKEGRLIDRPRKIKFELFPCDDVDTEADLCQLAAHGFIERYEVDGERLIQVSNFHKHQNPHRNEQQSILPANVQSTAYQGMSKDMPMSDQGMSLSGNGPKGSSNYLSTSDLGESELDQGTTKDIPMSDQGMSLSGNGLEGSSNYLSTSDLGESELDQGIPQDIPRYDQGQTKDIPRTYQGTTKDIPRSDQGHTKVEPWEVHARLDSLNPCIKPKEKNIKKRKIEKPKTDPNPTLAKPEDVSCDIWDDMLKLRKAKRAPMTETALKRIRSEAERAGISLEAAFVIMLARGWQGFESSWLERGETCRPTSNPDFSKIDYRACIDENGRF